MRVFLSVLLLIFGLQSWTKADDIKDFQIEGMSIGDSLLNYFTKKEIDKGKFFEKEQGSRKDVARFYDREKKDNYDWIAVSYKTNDKDYEILNEVISKKNDIESNLNQFKFREALKSLINIARIGNKFLADTEPWKIKNENPERVEQILKTSFEIVSYLAVLSEPFIPYTSKKLKKMIGINKSEWSDLENLGDKIDFSFTITNKEMLFRRIEDSEIEFQISKLKNDI